MFVNNYVEYCSNRVSEIKFSALYVFMNVHLCLVGISLMLDSNLDGRMTRNEVLLDQQRDVVIVFWACCILHLRLESYEFDIETLPPGSRRIVHCVNSGILNFELA
jgi:hypothetical protein